MVTEKMPRLAHITPNGWRLLPRYMLGDGKLRKAPNPKREVGSTVFIPTFCGYSKAYVTEIEPVYTKANTFVRYLYWTILGVGGVEDVDFYSTRRHALGRSLKRLFTGI